MKLISFGYKWGPPPAADLVLDVRYLPNPFWSDEFKSLSGLNPLVQDFVFQIAGSREHLTRLLQGWKGKTVAVGCSGGKHRSVSVVEVMGNLFGATVEHREMERWNEKEIVSEGISPRPTAAD